MKKWMLRVLICAGLMGLLCLTANAATGSVVSSGSCGDNVTYKLFSDGELVISGTGAMRNFSYHYGPTTPWGGSLGHIRMVTIDSGVTNIGDYAFYGCDTTSVTIPNSVIRIGDSAFQNCSKLNALIIGDSVTTIGTSAFWMCDNLSEVTIPDSVITIGEDAFYGCKALNTVTIGDGVTTIGEGAFYGCPGVITYGSCGDSLVWVLHNNGELQIAGTGYVQNNSYHDAPWRHVMDSIKTVALSDSVTGIQDYAFMGCTSVLKYGALEDSLAYVLCSDGKMQITGYGDIDDFSLSWSYDTYVSSAPWGYVSDRINIREITVGRFVTSIGANAFYGAKHLKRVDILGSVTTIGDKAFYGAKNLERVDIPDSVTTIGKSAFAGCGLSDIKMSCNVTYIGDYAFSSCPGVIAAGNCGSNVAYLLCSDGELKIVGTGAMWDWISYSGGPWKSYGSEIKTVNIGNGVTTIGNNAFYGCSGLTSVNIPVGVTTIGKSAFEKCSALAMVDIPVGVTSIGSNTFNGCVSLTNAFIPDSVTTIGDVAFYGCTGLTSINIPDRVNSIGYNAFYGCPQVSACGNCGNNLAWVLHSNGTLQITGSGEMWNWSESYHAPWYGEDGIQSVTISDRVSTVGDSAFVSCTGLKLGIYHGTRERWGQVSVGSGNEKLTESLYCGTPISLTVEGVEAAYPVGTTAVKPTSIILNLSTGELADITNLADVACDCAAVGQGEVTVGWDTLSATIPVTVYSGAHATIQIVDVHSATLKFYAQQAGQAFVAFYDITTGQMLDAQVFTMPTGNSEVTLTAEEVDLMAADCKIILLDGDSKPICKAIGP